MTEDCCASGGKMFCLAGIGAHLSGFVQSAWDVETMVAIDGCPVGCAKAILQQAKVPLKNHLVITELGIEKNKNLSLRAEDIARVKSAVSDTCGVKASAALTPITASCCG